MLVSNGLTAAAPERGRFRAFLRGCVDRFIVSHWRQESALKRGGGVTFISWEQDRAELRYQQEAADEMDPARLFDRSWAETLLDRVLGQLEQDLAREGRAHLFEQLKDRLADDGDAAPYAELAQRLGLTETALKTTVHRFRRRYRELLRREIAHTVASSAEVEEELRHLLAVVSA